MIYKTVTCNPTTGLGTVNTYQDGHNWADAHDRATGFGTNTDIQARVQSGPNAQIGRGFIPINTASIPAYAFILSATLYVYPYFKENTAGDGRMVLTYPTTQADTYSLSTDDYNKGGVNVASTLDYDSLTKDTFNAISIANPNSVITKAGVTKLGWRSYLDFYNSEPASGTTTVKLSESSAPYLIISYALFGKPRSAF